MTSRWADRALRVIPYLGGLLAAFVVAPLPGTPAVGSLSAAICATAAFALVLPLVAGRRGSTARLVVVMTFLLAVFMLKAAEGSLRTGVSALVLLPVIWVALSGTARELAATVAAVAAYFVAPVFVVGGADYPVSSSPRGLVVAAVAGAAGVLVQQLVGKVRVQAREAVRRECELALLIGLLREIGEADDVRPAVCAAARTLTEAPACVLFERDAAGRMVATAAAGASVADVVVDEEADDAIAVAIRGRSRVTIDDPAERLPALCAALGDAPALVIEPVVGAGLSGALVLASASAGEHGDALQLLAMDAASVIARADLLAAWETLALSDPLTGLPNRRVWDQTLAAALARAQRHGEPLSVALLDIDHFKAFNDEHGHQAGDRLLKEAAATWQRELREGDVLARWGGDEFAVLLAGQGLAEAAPVVERLRAAVTDHACSAGIAELRVGDDATALVARADGELYAAKAARRQAAG